MHFFQWPTHNCNICLRHIWVLWKLVIFFTAFFWFLLSDVFSLAASLTFPLLTLRWIKNTVKRFANSRWWLIQSNPLDKSVKIVGHFFDDNGYEYYDILFGSLTRHRVDEWFIRFPTFGNGDDILWGQKSSNNQRNLADHLSWRIHLELFWLIKTMDTKLKWYSL